MQNNFQNQYPSNQQPGMNSATTGKQEYYYKSNATGVEERIKNNFNDPITGTSQKENINLNYKQGDSAYQQGVYNTTTNAYNPPTNPNMNYNTNATYNPNLNPNTNYVPNPNTNVTYSTTSATYDPNSNMNYNAQTYTQNPNTNYMAPNQNLVNQPLNSGCLEEKGQIKQRGNTTKTYEETKYVDPVTGQKCETEVKTKVRGEDNMGYYGNDKSKTAYEKKVENTPYGQEVKVQEKHREGGIMDNLKNKIHNIVHR